MSQRLSEYFDTEEGKAWFKERLLDKVGELTNHIGNNVPSNREAQLLVYGDAFIDNRRFESLPKIKTVAAQPGKSTTGGLGVWEKLLADRLDNFHRHDTFRQEFQGIMPNPVPLNAYVPLELDEMVRGDRRHAMIGRRVFGAAYGNMAAVERLGLSEPKLPEKKKDILERDRDVVCTRSRGDI